MRSIALGTENRRRDGAVAIKQSRADEARKYHIGAIGCALREAD